MNGLVGSDGRQVGVRTALAEIVDAYERELLSAGEAPEMAGCATLVQLRHAEAGIRRKGKPADWNVPKNGPRVMPSGYAVRAGSRPRRAPLR